MTTLVEIMGIGREILDGRVVDTNSVAIAEKLKPLGLVPRYAQKVDDDFERAREAFQVASQRSSVVLVTGGLGPTSDDLTAEAFSRFLGVPLELNPEALAQVESVFKRMNRTMSEVQKKQAYLPRGCKILKNSVGTAPGFSWQHSNGQKWYFMPGVPREMLKMLEDNVLPDLPRAEVVRSKTWLTQFTSEGKLQEQLGGLEKRLLPGMEITYRTKLPENHIGLYFSKELTATQEEDERWQELLRGADALLAGQSFASFSHGEPLPSLEKCVVAKALKLCGKIATVESCTGGLVAHRLTEVAGVSQVFLGSQIVYSELAKSQWLGVSQQRLNRFGAVSPEIAQDLAELGLKSMEIALGIAEKAAIVTEPAFVPLYCVSITGLAGPEGGSPETPVGTCWIALASSLGPTRVEKFQTIPSLDRSQIKWVFSQKVLAVLLDTLG